MAAFLEPLFPHELQQEGWYFSSGAPAATAVAMMAVSSLLEWIILQVYHWKHIHLNYQGNSSSKVRPLDRNRPLKIHCQECKYKLNLKFTSWIHSSIIAGGNGGVGVDKFRLDGMRSTTEIMNSPSVSILKARQRAAAEVTCAHNATASYGSQIVRTTHWCWCWPLSFGNSFFGVSPTAEVVNSSGSFVESKYFRAPLQSKKYCFNLFIIYI